MASRPGIVRRFFGGLWWLLDFSRRLVLNLLFLALLVLLAVAWWVGSRPAHLQEKTALVLNLSGELVEQDDREHVVGRIARGRRAGFVIKQAGDSYC